MSNCPVGFFLFTFFWRSSPSQSTDQQRMHFFPHGHWASEDVDGLKDKVDKLLTVVQRPQAFQTLDEMGSSYKHGMFSSVFSPEEKRSTLNSSKTPTPRILTPGLLQFHWGNPVKLQALQLSTVCKGCLIKSPSTYISPYVCKGNVITFFPALCLPVSVTCAAALRWLFLPDPGIFRLEARVPPPLVEQKRTEPEEPGIFPSEDCAVELI